MVEDPLLAMASAASTAHYPMTPPEEHTNELDSLESAKLPDTPMSDQDETEAFEDTIPEFEADMEKPHLVTHVKVYAIAEKYGIPGLKSLARKKFAQQLQLHVNSLEFSEACQEAYETTVDTDRGQRDVVIHAFRSDPNLALRRDVEMAVRETPGLAFELYRMASGLPVTSLTV